jgi:hypothetical protein
MRTRAGFHRFERRRGFVDNAFQQPDRARRGAFRSRGD